MTTKKVLVLGATGPSGISLLRELLYRKYSTVAYVRSPSKIPDDISSNSLLTVSCLSPNGKITLQNTFLRRTSIGH